MQRVLLLAWAALQLSGAESDERAAQGERLDDPIHADRCALLQKGTVHNVQLLKKANTSARHRSFPEAISQFLKNPLFSHHARTARSRACLSQFEDLDSELMDALDQPWLKCFPHLRTQSKGSLLQQHLTDYPLQHVTVGVDPIKNRGHLFVVGPESSGTCFVRQYIGAALGYSVPKAVSDFKFFEDTTMWHVSLTEGSNCDDTLSVPILDDFGFGYFGFGNWLQELSQGLPVPFRDGQLPWNYPSRFYLNLTSMVEQYRQRNESITIFQVARNPFVSVVSKMNNGHCSSEDVSQQEQSLAFDILLQAKDLPEVTTLCFERILEEGQIYLDGMLSKAGINAIDGAQLPAIKVSATTSNHDVECTADVKAYLQLCPDSPDSEQFRSVCES
ncbi:unnamed protein product [Polarella glacialis]|uniref:Protein-tyrosine sulfotransferase n=1 Tax=Polarella glacialis TaxID=89957 RepID=A0A813HP00_POLGL|nr:unnamed protein product [Polarella glacialis]CAE8674683.1 unnamed protein product [Polarella glacialis]